MSVLTHYQIHQISLLKIYLHFNLKQLTQQSNFLEIYYLQGAINFVFKGSVVNDFQLCKP